jgi:hypothetical protein
MIYGEIRKPDHKGRVCLGKHLKEGEEVEVWWLSSGLLWKRVQKVARGGRILTPFKKQNTPEGVGILIVEGVWRRILFVFREKWEVERGMEELKRAGYV